MFTVCLDMQLVHTKILNYMCADARMHYHRTSYLKTLYSLHYYMIISYTLVEHCLTVMLTPHFALLLTTTHLFICGDTGRENEFHWVYIHDFEEFNWHIWASTINWKWALVAPAFIGKHEEKLLLAAITTNNAEPMRGMLLNEEYNLNMRKWWKYTSEKFWWRDN